VLLIEDHDESREMLTALLTYAGAFVMAAASVDDALDRSRGVLFDVIVTDIGLRQKPGTWFVDDGRRLPRFAGVPVIAVTGRDIPPTLRAMFDAVVEKPVDHDELIMTITRLVG
jgi:CheY-like chemotaxis protein